MPRRPPVRRKPVIRWASLDDVKPNPVNLSHQPAPPKLKKKAGTPEHDYQVSQVAYLRLQFPGWVVFAVENEATPCSKVIGVIKGWMQKRKDAGVEKGIVDVIGLGPFPLAFFIENKAPGKYPKPHQRAIHNQLRDLGWNVHVSRSLDDLIPWLREKGLLRA